MKKTLRDRIAAPSAMNVPALREEHRNVFGKEPVSLHQRFLLRKIAWQVQAAEEGWQPDVVEGLARETLLSAASGFMLVRCWNSIFASSRLVPMELPRAWRSRVRSSSIRPPVSGSVSQPLAPRETGSPDGRRCGTAGGEVTRGHDVQAFGTFSEYFPLSLGPALNESNELRPGASVAPTRTDTPPVRLGSIQGGTTLTGRWMLMKRVFALLLVLGAVCQADSISFVVGTPHVVTPALSGFSTDGADMAGMQVTGYYGSLAVPAVWVATSATAGQAQAVQYFVIGVNGDTFSSTWTLRNLASDPLTRLRLFGPPGNTVFDVCWERGDPNCMSLGSEGSRRGWDFTRRGGTFTGTVDAVYSDIVAIGGDPTVGDLWATLDLYFGNGGIGRGQTLKWRSDTDSGVVGARIQPVPEPASIVLVMTAGALVGLAYRRRRAG